MSPPRAGGGSPERRRKALPAALLQAVVDQLLLAIFIFRGGRLVYVNPSGTRLIRRMRDKYGIEVPVMLLDHLTQVRERSQAAATVVSLTGDDKEPFVVRLFEIGRRGDVAASVREIGGDLSEFGDRYRLSRRELQVTELVLRGHRNETIAATLGIAPATAKKHLSSIFDKVGVTSRAELASRLL